MAPTQGTTYCGCDEAAGWVCSLHSDALTSISEFARKEEEQALTRRKEKKATAVSYTIADSGQRQQFASGMVRDTSTDKTDYSLALDGPMFERLAVHLTKGAQKYSARNWMLASTPAEMERFKASAVRHFIQWLRGDQDEDHAAAVFFNINGVCYVQNKLHDGEHFVWEKDTPTPVKG